MKISTTILMLWSLLNAYEIIAQSKKEPEQIIERLFKENIVAGVAGGYSVDGNIRFTHGAGYMNSSAQMPFTENTLTRIASIAKPMTAVAIMQLYEKKLIDLDVPIQTYLIDFPKNPEGNITIRHLLNQTSGIDGYQSVKEMQNKKEFATMTEAVSIFKNRKLSFSPGSGYQYTTYGYVVLGLIIERVSGITYEQYMIRNIWSKAGMSDTGVEKFNQNYQNKSSLYHSRKGKIRKGEKTNLSNRIPGGGIYSTVIDLLKFGNAILDETLIKKSTLELMLHNPNIRKKGNGYGFGWFLYGENPDFGNIFGHSGEQTGAANQLMILPEIGTAVVLLSNTSGTWQDVVNSSVQLFRPAYQSRNTHQQKIDD